MIPRLLPLVLALTLVAGVVTGCTPEPAPSPTATGFATEEEAFAAAEETYRAYVDALNQVDLSDPETFEAVYAWTTGELNSADRKTFAQMHADRWTVGGQSQVALVAPRQMGGPDGTEVDLAVCVDVGAVTLTDETGASVVDSDRAALQSTLVSLEPSSSSSTGLLITNIVGREGEPECV